MKALLARKKKKRLGNFLSEKIIRSHFFCLTVGFQENLTPFFFSEKRNDLILPSTETLIVSEAAQGVRPEMTGREAAFRKSCRWLPYRSMLPAEVCVERCSYHYMKSDIFTVFVSLQLENLCSQECYHWRFLFVIVLHMRQTQMASCLRKVEKLFQHYIYQQ